MKKVIFAFVFIVLFAFAIALADSALNTDSVYTKMIDSPLTRYNLQWGMSPKEVRNKVDFQFDAEDQREEFTYLIHYEAPIYSTFFFIDNELFKVQSFINDDPSAADDHVLFDRLYDHFDEHYGPAIFNYDDSPEGQLYLFLFSMAYYANDETELLGLAYWTTGNWGTVIHLYDEGSEDSYYVSLNYIDGDYLSRTMTEMFSSDGQNGQDRKTTASAELPADDEKDTILSTLGVSWGMSPDQVKGIVGSDTLQEELAQNGDFIMDYGSSLSEDIWKLTTFVFSDNKLYNVEEMFVNRGSGDAHLDLFEDIKKHYEDAFGKGETVAKRTPEGLLVAFFDPELGGYTGPDTDFTVWIVDETTSIVQSVDKSTKTVYVETKDLTVDEDYIYILMNTSRKVLIEGQDKQNYEVAFDLLKKAAMLGDPEAISNIGKAYMYWPIDEQDFDQAMQWLLRASDLGDADAMDSIGLCYYYGYGVDVDYEKAAKWYQKAAENGSGAGYYNLGILYQKGRYFEQSDEKAFENFEKSMEMGYVYAFTAAGIFYANGIVVEENQKKAIELWEQAASLGDLDAYTKLGQLYAYGQGSVEKDIDKAIEWLEKGANQGNTDAMVSLGLIYADEDNEVLDYLKAESIWKQAAKYGNVDAMENLISMYIYGDGDLTIEEAKEYANMAIENGSQFASYMQFLLQ